MSSVQQGGIKSQQSPLSSIESDLFMLDMPGLWEITGLGMRVGVHYHGFWEIHLAASSKHVFSNCSGWHIPVPETPSVLCQAMIQCPACFPDVRPWALTTGDAVHHPYLVFRMGIYVQRVTYGARTGICASRYRWTYRVRTPVDGNFFPTRTVYICIYIYIYI